MNNNNHSLNIGIICGGPTLERGISLNSARSLLDHLSREGVKLHPIYVDYFENFYSISTSQLYSNTPSDFDFKLHKTATKLNRDELITKLKEMDIVFPVIHGFFGEGGSLQSFFEKHDIPYIGCDSKACKAMFNKHRASKLLNKSGFKTIPSALLHINFSNNEEIIRHFFIKHQLKRAVVKPSAGGSSIGVFSAYTADEAIEKCHQLFKLKLDNEAIIEPFCSGHEFTVIILQSIEGKPVALVPSEIKVSYDNGQIFDYRRKYLPTNNTMWLCPPHFDDLVVEQIQHQAEELFNLFGMKDFARLDGWVLDDGNIVFTDFNPISGMEQNSFIFQQGSRIGLTHRDLLWNIVKNACHREKVAVIEHRTKEKKKKPVRVLFGGATAERQVSIMSGTNVWLKLRQSDIYQASPFFLDQKGYVWSLPYTYAFNHTSEEIYENCITAHVTIDRLDKFVKDIRSRLNLINNHYEVKENIPTKMSFEKFLDETKKENAFLFLSLHGGDGENGVIQQKIEEFGIEYNGSGPQCSELCMNKYITGQAIDKIGDASISTIPKRKIHLTEPYNYNKQEYIDFWNKLKNEIHFSKFIIKPNADGCSAGIIQINSPDDLEKYVELIRNKALFIPPNTFNNQESIIEMSVDSSNDYLIEGFIETDFICIQQNDLIYKQKDGWLELTVGVLESRGNYQSLNPSITIAEGNVLSVEEKFQSGTGINITPPPSEIISDEMVNKIKTSIEKVAKSLGIKNYARIDIFFNVKTEKMIVIEANTLPGLTASTVIYHQALAEIPPMDPIKFLEKIIELKTTHHSD